MNASHCVSLSVQSESDIRRISEKVAAAKISVTALPQTNLFLQGRGVISGTPRAITPINALLEAGVTVAAGADNLQDPFNLMGRGDPLEIASLLVTASHASPTAAHHMITQASSIVVTGQSTEIAVGHRANLVAIKAATLRESIAMGPPDRHVVYGGVVIDNQNRNRK
jgi:cytosine deaminase